MTDIATSPLRPPRVRQPNLAQWLQTRTRTVCDTWIARIIAHPPASSGQPLPAPSDSDLRQAYDDLCSGLQTGRFAEFDASLETLTRQGYQRGYRLNDLLYLVIALSEQIWQACAAEFLPDRAMAHLQPLASTFNGALTFIARIYGEETQARVASDLEQAQRRLGQLDRAKSSFIGVAAHELRTPLTLIQGYSDILLNDLIDPANERAVMVANGLVAGARRLLQIVNDMIAVSMIDNEMLALHFQPTSLGHILNIVAADLKGEMAEREVAIAVQPMPDAVKNIYADSQRLYDAFMHVLGNSVKYTPDGGHVTIDCRVLSPGQGEEPIAEITIADDGIGIAPEHRERIFEKFYGTTDVMRHSSGRTKFKGGGPGLGLVVTRGIIEAHGGKIWVESPGYDEVKRPGTSVHILLPMRTSPPETRDRLKLDLD